MADGMCVAQLRREMLEQCVVVRMAVLYELLAGASSTARLEHGQSEPRQAPGGELAAGSPAVARGQAG